MARAVIDLKQEEMLETYRRALLDPNKASLSVFYSVEKAPKEKPVGTLVQDVKKLKTESSVYQ